MVGGGSFSWLYHFTSVRIHDAHTFMHVINNWKTQNGFSKSQEGAICFLRGEAASGNKLNCLSAITFYSFSMQPNSSIHLWGVLSQLKDKYCVEATLQAFVKITAFSRKYPTCRFSKVFVSPGSIMQLEHRGTVTSECGDCLLLRICSPGGGFLGLEGIIRLKNGI